MDFSCIRLLKWKWKRRCRHRYASNNTTLNVGVYVFTPGLLQLTVVRHYRQLSWAPSSCAKCCRTLRRYNSPVRTHHANSTGCQCSSTLNLCWLSWYTRQCTSCQFSTWLTDCQLNCDNNKNIDKIIVIIVVYMLVVGFFEKPGLQTTFESVRWTGSSLEVCG